MTEAKVAVVGCGYWGRNLVRNFADLGALHIICDSDRKALEQMGSTYRSARLTDSFAQVLRSDEISGVVIATPARLHAPMAREALAAGKDVLVEKPLALELSEGRALVELAQRLGRLLMVGHVLAYHPAVLKLKELVSKGHLGRIQYIYSNRLNLGKVRTEENILWSFAPHDISIILVLLGEMPREVSAHGGSYITRGVPDVTVTTMTFPSGVSAHIFVSWLHPHKEQRLVVVGDRAMAVLDDVAPKDKLLLYNHRVDWVDRQPVAFPQNPSPVEVALAEPLRLECQHFLECMVTRATPRTDGYSGLRVLEILEAAQRSLQEQGRNVALGGDRATNVFIHESSIIDQGCQIGEGTKVWHFCHLMPDVVIGKNCVLGQNIFVGRGVRIGNGVRIQNNVSVFEGVTLEDDVFCGPSAVFTNVTYARSHISRRGEFQATLVKKGASIGANATILCGHTIGEYAFIGAGAVVTSDVPDYALAYGVPARLQGWVCRCGVRLTFSDGNAVCPACQRAYTKEGDRVQEAKQ